MKLQQTRVLNFIYTLATGGTERQFVYTTRALHERGLSMHTGLILRKGQFLKDLQELGIPVTEYATPSMYSPRTLRQQIRLGRDMRRLGIRVLHAYGFYANVFAIPAARVAQVPVVLASVRDTGIYLNPLMRRAQAAACRLAHCVVANSGAVRDWLATQGIRRETIHVIRNGIAVPDDVPPKEHLLRKQLGFSLETPVVATVCRLNRSKGLEYLLEAAVEVARAVPDVRFLIVGGDGNEPGYKVELERLAARLNVTTNVWFLGERKDVSEILKEADVFVLPSLSEGLSNVLLEAMVAKLPIVATNVGGNPEVVEQDKTGLLVPPKETAALARAICQLLSNRELVNRFGEAGRRRVVSHFSLQDMVNQTQELYLSLLESDHPRQAAA